MTISIESGPTHGKAVIDDNGTPTISWDDFVTYTPDEDFHGEDSFTYEIDDGKGNTDTAEVKITVASVNDAELHVSGEYAVREGALVSVQLETPGHNGAALSFTAKGLPSGLSLDSETGVISGRPVYTAAQTNDGEYEIEITATNGTDTDTETVTWYVEDVNRLQQPDDQVGLADDIVELPLVANDEIGNELTFSATGLPDGLAIDSKSGEITGILEEYEDEESEFEVTVSVTGGGATDSRTFAWKVLTLESGDARVVIAVNNTIATTDDMAFLSAGPVPATVYLFAPRTTGDQTVELEMTPGKGSLRGYPERNCLIQATFLTGRGYLNAGRGTDSLGSSRFTIRPTAAIWTHASLDRVENS